MDTDFHEVLHKTFERSLADEEPWNRLIEVLRMFRWPDWQNGQSLADIPPLVPPHAPA